MTQPARSSGDRPPRSVAVPRPSYPGGFDISPLALCVVDLSGVVEEVNPTFEVQIGVLDDDAACRPLGGALALDSR